MSNEIIDLEQRLNKQVGRANQLVDVKFYPLALEEDVSISQERKIPFSKLVSLSPAFESMASTFQKALGGEQAGSGLYRVTVPEGLSLAKFRKEDAYLGSVLTEAGAVGGGQARLRPMTIDPSMLMVAAALHNIDKKLDSIMEVQKEILDFLKQKEKSQLRGDFKFLNDVLSNYKFNWDNEKYKNSNHIKVLDIRQESERKIDFYRRRLKSKLDKRTFIQSNKRIEKEREHLDGELRDYQLALYLYAFSSFLEVILLENYDKDYLDNIINKIEDYSYDYREIYTQVHIEIEVRIRASLDNKLVGGIGSLTSLSGKTVGKIPVINRTSLDEKLISTGDKMERKRIEKEASIIQPLLDRQSSYVRPFIDSIRDVKLLYNHPMDLLFDKENIYLSSE